MLGYLVGPFDMNIFFNQTPNFLWTVKVIRFHKSSFELCCVFFQIRILKLYTS